MNKISISQAWAYATSFFNGQHPNHAIALIGVGVVGPLLLNLLLGGGAMTMDPATLASNPGAVAAMGGGLLLSGFLGFILQSGSYYASWRMGLMPGQESVGSALSYGLVAALPVLLVTIGFILVIGIVLGIVFGASILPLIASGGAPSGDAMAGAGLMVVLGVPITLLLLLWLAARLCCMGPVMAQARSYNPLTAIAESWRMTAASQWKLMGYFVLLAVVIFILFMIVGMVAGVSMLAGGTASGAGMGAAIIMGVLMGVPMAYLYVAVPAGIYRALGGGGAGDVFA
jgi:hypothetical protein